MTKIVFIGDSITNGGGDVTTAAYPFPQIARDVTGYNTVNAGVPGDTTSDMVTRFDTDVIAESPDYVVILGGINDILTSVSLPTIEDNLSTMITAANTASIDPVLCMLTPCNSKTSEVSQLNSWIANYGLANHFPVVDLFTPLVDPTTPGNLATIYNFGDDIHPNQAGHEIIAAGINEVAFNIPQRLQIARYGIFYYNMTLWNRVNKL